MLRIDIESHGGVATLHCSGRIVVGLECDTLRTIAMSRTEKSIKVDLANTETVDAAGLGLLIKLQRWAEREKRKMEFTNANEFVWSLVVLTKLYGIVNICPADKPEVCEKLKRTFLQESALRALIA